MLTGRRAFDGESPASVIAAHLSSEPPPLVDLAPLTPAPVARVSACLAKNPDERWQSASDLAFELRSLTEPSQIVPAVADQRRRQVPPGRLAAAAAGRLSASGGLVVRPSKNDRPASEVRLTILPPSGYEFAGSIAQIRRGLRRITGRDRTSRSSPAMLRVCSALDPAARLVTPRLVSGTEGAERPFWSPDSRFIGFTSDAGICRVALSRRCAAGHRPGRRWWTATRRAAGGL